jgi:hypothetical protein
VTEECLFLVTMKLVQVFSVSLIICASLAQDINKNEEHPGAQEGKELRYYNQVSQYRPKGRAKFDRCDRKIECVSSCLPRMNHKINLSNYYSQQ